MTQQFQPTGTDVALTHLSHRDQDTTRDANQKMSMDPIIRG